MKTYKVKIIETLVKEVEVEANSLAEAYDIVNKKYDNEEIVLSSDDFVDVAFDAI